MQKLSKRILALIIFATIISVGTTKNNVYADSANSNNNEITTFGANTGFYIKSSKWTTVASSSKGINNDLTIFVHNTSISTNHIRMLDRYGRVIWEENNAIGNSGSRVFWCGPDVYTVQLRPAIGEASGSAFW